MASISIQLNGTLRRFETDGTSPLTLATVVASLEIQSMGLMAQVNQTLYKYTPEDPDTFNRVALHNGDQVELIQFMGGG